MTRIVNLEQSQAWNGYEGTHWATHAERYDAVNSGFNEPLLAAAALAAGEHVLDVGCGNGQLTRLAATAAAPGRVLGVDLSEPMLAAARSSTTAPNVDFVRGDAQVHPFPAGRTDVVLSRFGVMFFADPVAAFTNLRRALRPGGRLVFVCLRRSTDDDLGTVFGALAARLAPGAPPAVPADVGPLSFADPARVRSVLTDAGFADVGCRPVDAEQIWGRDVADAAGFIAAWGPVRHQLSQVDAATAAAATTALTEALTPYERAGAVRLRGAAWLVTAVTR